MWPFGGRRIGKTIAETRKDNTSALVSVANQIHDLQSRVVKIERDAPYVKNDRERERLDMQKIKLERQIKALEQKHEKLAKANKG